MSGNPFSGGSPFQRLDPGDALVTNMGNSLTGMNVGGQGGMSNNWGTHVGNNLTGFNLFNAGNNSLDAMNAANAAANPSSIGQLPNVGGPQFANPNSWGMPTPQGGFWNQIAQQMAGPVYTGGLQVPGVSPSLRNMPIGASGKGGISQSGGKGGLVPVQQQTPINSPVASQGNYMVPRMGGGSFNLGRRAGYQTQ